MAFSTDTDLQAIVPDILSFGIASFASEHALARADIERDIRFKWYPKLRLSSEMNPALLTDSQWTKVDEIVMFPNNYGVEIQNIEVAGKRVIKHGVFLNESRIFGTCEPKDNEGK